MYKMEYYKSVAVNVCGEDFFWFMKKEKSEHAMIIPFIIMLFHGEEEIMTSGAQPGVKGILDVQNGR